MKYEIYKKHLICDETQKYQDAINLLEMMVFIDACNFTNDLNESILDNVKSIGKKISSIFDDKIKPGAKKVGIHVDTKKGMIHYITGMSINTAKMLYYAVDYFYNGNKDAKNKIIDIAKSIKKEEIIDFLLKLDGLTLHLFMEPIHIIDNLTGLDIEANVRNAGKDISQRAHEAIKSIEELKDKLEGKLRSQLQNYANALRRIFGVEGFKKVNEDTITPDIAEPEIKIGDTARRRLKDKSCKRRRRVCAKSKNGKFLCYDDIKNALDKD